MTHSPLRAVVYSLIILLGVLCALPNVLPAVSPNMLGEQLPSWYRDTTFKLGLDLRGGSHLLLEIDQRQLLSEHNQQLSDSLRRSLRENNLRIDGIESSDQRILIRSRSAQELPALAQQVKSELKQPGVEDLYRIRSESSQLTITLTDSFRTQLLDDAIERSLDILRKRLDESGLVEPSITRQGSESILVQLPGVDNPQSIRKLLGTTAKMSFHWVADGRSASTVQTLQLPGDDGERFRLEREQVLSGEHISDARLGFNQESGQPVINFRLDSRGASLFSELTANNIGRALAIVLDNRVLTAPVIRSMIGANGEISGNFTVPEASNLALMLRAGALPAKLHVIEERTVGPDLGSDSIAMGLTTGLIGTALVVAFMLASYRSWGLIACAALGVNVILIFGVLSLLGATLTLPGIAGLILTIGMAVDANILINERIREETRRGKSAQLALQEGFDRAYATILDSNLTTLIAVSLLFMFGSGPVRGFAVTIGIGLLTSLFTSVAVTRQIMQLVINRRRRKPLPLPKEHLLDRLTRNPLNVMRGRRAGLIGSAVLSLASVVFVMTPGLNYGVDFSGGTVIEMELPNSTQGDLRQLLSANGIGSASVQGLGSDDSSDRYLVRLPIKTAGEAEMTNGSTVEQIRSLISAAHPEASIERVDQVGPKISASFGEDTVLAILLACGGLLAYLWVRFEAHFALAATLTIALDLTKTLGFFALFGVEFNLTAVAAMLALIGYSINDKVVVFDRIREYLRANPDQPLLELLNTSITATLTRTVFTSATTFVALLPMAIAGGHAVASFAQPMLFGIVIGTSSSVLIASPIVYLLGKRRISKGQSQLRPTREQIQSELDLLP
ncbi:SecD/SecF fusion protein [Litorivivens lipolytica]|uniref:Multifunctional fusion protein n=1 Tax=Litorivivens lipolytica TaxID=1524264 RepID=A0A7W4W425_9GAMM|nr:protein translocase subunit SecD [Litorivivens lipolytica]MBB3047019.1 SecD/SecF fusion protein [Litorivivens lipolytica]